MFWRLFHKLVYFLRRQLTLISTRHRRHHRQHHRQHQQQWQWQHRQWQWQHHPSDSAALIISFLWPMFLASRMQTAFCDFVTVIGHINLCSRTTLAQLPPPTAKIWAARAALVAWSAVSRVGAYLGQFFIALCDAKTAKATRKRLQTLSNRLVVGGFYIHNAIKKKIAIVSA